MRQIDGDKLLEALEQRYGNPETRNKVEIAEDSMVELIFKWVKEGIFDIPFYIEQARVDEIEKWKLRAKSAESNVVKFSQNISELSESLMHTKLLLRDAAGQIEWHVGGNGLSNEIRNFVATLENETEDCPTCGGSGFSGYGNGYDAVCDTCAGAREVLKNAKR